MRLPQWLLILSGLLSLAVLLGVVAKRLRVPLTVVLALVGLAAGTLARSMAWLPPLHGAGFEEAVVFGFLPVLVFAAVIEIPVRSFLRNLVPIVALAVVALIIGTALVGVGVSALLGVPLVTALLFGALIAATDPVAVVAVFRDVGVPQRLLTLVEGESLLNDGTAIVLFEILLAAAVGAASLSPATAVASFAKVFFGGAAVGLAIGFAAAVALPWLDRLGAATMTLGVAYGSFVLADDILGFSGVMATVVAGLVLAGFAPSRASSAVRQTWEQLWESVDYVVNAVLFLLIGLVMAMVVRVEHLAPMVMVVVLVLIARALAVFPVVALLERLGHVPRVGKRNEAVLVWGGLRGGVALALALALPESLPQRELFVSMTTGVVFATLALNATTISALVRRLGLNEPTRTDQLLAATARLSGIRAAREQLDALGISDAAVIDRLHALRERAVDELHSLEMTRDEEVQAVLRRGLHVERDTYQHLSDAGLIPPPVARTLLAEVAEQIESLTAGTTSPRTVGRTPAPALPRAVQALVSRLPKPPGEDPETLAYAEATARRLASRATAEALRLFEDMPNIDAAAVAEARTVFCVNEDEAAEEVTALDRGDGQPHHLREAQADALARVAAGDALAQLADAGLLPAKLAAEVGAAVAADLPSRYA